MTSQQEPQQTLAIVPVIEKDNFKAQINSHSNTLTIVLERKFNPSLDTFSKDIKEQQYAYGFIIQGSNAIEDWLSIIISANANEKSLLHGSSDPDNARRETSWFSQQTTESVSTSSIPVKVNRKTSPATKKTIESSQKKPTVRNTSTANKSLPVFSKSPSALRIPATVSRNSSNTTKSNTNTSHTTLTATAKISTKTPITITAKKIEPKDKGAIPIMTKKSGSSVTSAPSVKKVSPARKTGVVASNLRTKKTATEIKKQPTSSVQEKKKPASVTVEKKTPVVSTVVNTQQQEEDSPQTQPYSINSPEKEPAILKEEVPVKNDAFINIDEENSAPDTVIQKLTENATSMSIIESHEPSTSSDSLHSDEAIALIPTSHSTCSSAATDEHDAEVAAATSKQPSNQNSVTLSAIQQSQKQSNYSYNYSPALSSATSPTTSLSRPETPEVDQLRMKFENIVQQQQYAAKNDGVRPSVIRRGPSSEIVSRIKELKPREPAGSKIKSMVNLFMDENLNKWEF